MSVNIAVESGKICNKTTMGERLQGICEDWIVDEMDVLQIKFPGNNILSSIPIFYHYKGEPYQIL